MTVFIVLFRAIGGANQLSVQPLKEALLDAGFGNVATYIQTGNVVLTSDLDQEAVVAKVGEIVEQRFGRPQKIIVRNARHWSEIVAANPFPDAVSEPTTLHVFVLEAEPSPEAVKLLESRQVDGERVAVIGSVAYLHTPDGAGISKLAKSVERLLKVPATARNWNTMMKLQEMAEKAATE
ncbi:hypothetical protein ATN84_07590 [Paramesorhizobium deserti]|uniref:DUF1697 domain-containing protein n=1 Tax=Paramesorhizobium deserti TaxID=1494590 RepID=A0A135HVN9_9HYPH|nr:DUF1697 domain-containing protein [Paramesorhizobium deserti]KXF77256.1 hypothetical protein ATN84_07590 [Paramesorhizobium deserti]